MAYTKKVPEKRFISPLMPCIKVGVFSLVQDKENLEEYVAGKGMRKQAKIRIMCTVTLLMSTGFILMSAKGVFTGCMVLGCVWILHILYFTFKVKTIPE